MIIATGIIIGGVVGLIYGLTRKNDEEIESNADFLRVIESVSTTGKSKKGEYRDGRFEVCFSDLSVYDKKEDMLYILQNRKDECKLIDKIINRK